MTSRFTSPYPPITPPRQSFYTFLREQDRFRGDLPFSVHGLTAEVATRAQVLERAHALARGLRNVHRRGMKPLPRGATALVLSPMNSMYAVYMLALGAAGICAALVNPALVEAELAHAFTASGASHLLVDASALPLAARTLRTLGYAPGEMRHIVVVVSADGAPRAGDGWTGMDALDCAPVPGVPEAFDGDAADASAFIYFSSGTTGLSKAVALSHANVCANLAQYRAACPYFQRGREALLAVAPPFHVLGGQITILTAFLLGVTLVILPRFVPEDFLRCIEQYRVTVMITVPPVLQFLTNSPLPDEYDLSSLRVIIVGAAPVSPDMIVACRERYAKRGVKINIGQGLGMTEMCGIVTILPLEHMPEKTASVGWLLPNTEGRLVDDDGVDVPVGTPGELWLRSPSTLEAYANNPEATAEAYAPDGWFMTGDVATVDKDGFVSITERKKELIKYKGFQVAPAELESVLNTHPEVADCAVIGVYSDEQATELPKAYIVPKDETVLALDGALFAKQIHEWLAPRVAHFKYLRGGIALIAEIPKSVSGKILKRKLRELEEQTRVVCKL